MHEPLVVTSGGQKWRLVQTCLVEDHKEGLCRMLLPIWLPGPMFLRGGPVQGVSVQGGSLSGRRAGVTHPTGMFSC